MEAFATVDDLTEGWKELSEAEEARATVLLDRASAQLAGLLAKHGVAIDPSDRIQHMNLVSVTCNMVKRAMSNGYENVTSFAQSVGSTNISVNYRDSDGAFYISKSEREVLGITGRGRMLVLRTAIHTPDGSLVDGW